MCNGKHTIKYGVRKGVQLYKCQDCGYQFRAGVEVSENELWNAYQQKKQTIKELSERFEKDKNDEITARMVEEISQQIERCLGKMAEVVEIPLG